jgi:hypothetical protein
VKLPWAEPSSRFTALLEGLAIVWLPRRKAEPLPALGRTKNPSGEGIITLRW